MKRIYLRFGMMLLLGLLLSTVCLANPTWVEAADADTPKIELFITSW